MLRRAFSIVLLAGAVAGCSRNLTSASQSNSAGSAQRTSDVITAEELAAPAVRSGDALEAVRRLRPRFLASRGSGSIRVRNAGTVQVSLDGGPLQSASYLSRLRAGEIAEIRFLNATDATQRFGTAAASGSVMLVKSK